MIVFDVICYRKLHPPVPPLPGQWKTLFSDWSPPPTVSWGCLFIYQSIRTANSHYSLIFCCFASHYLLGGYYSYTEMPSSGISRRLGCMAGDLQSAKRNPSAFCVHRFAYSRIFSAFPSFRPGPFFICIRSRKIIHYHRYIYYTHLSGWSNIYTNSVYAAISPSSPSPTMRYFF